MKGVVLFRVDDAERRLLRQTAHQEKVQQKCDGSHNQQFPERMEKDQIRHAAGLYGNVVADHGVDHHEHHENGKNNFLHFVFGHKKILLE